MKDGVSTTVVEYVSSYQAGLGQSLVMAQKVLVSDQGEGRKGLTQV